MTRVSITKSQVLDIRVFVIGHYTTEGAEPGDKGKGGHRIKVRFLDIDEDISEDIRSVLKKRKGRTVISCRYTLEDSLRG